MLGKKLQDVQWILIVGECHSSSGRIDLMAGHLSAEWALNHQHVVLPFVHALLEENQVNACFHKERKCVYLDARETQRMMTNTTKVFWFPFFWIELKSKCKMNKYCRGTYIM